MFERFKTEKYFVVARKHSFEKNEKLIASRWEIKDFTVICILGDWILFLRESFIEQKEMV